MSKILLLESDKILADNLARFLRARGHSVQWAAEPQAAIEAADRRQPDIVVMDLVLGGHSGIEFLYELRSYPEWEDLPVIILSSLSEKEFLADSASLAHIAVAGFYYKPRTSLDEVAKAVKNAAQTVPG